MDAGKLTRSALLSLFMLLFSFGTCAAGNEGAVQSYSEFFASSAGKDAVLYVEMKAVPDEEGNVYIPVNVNKAKLLAVQVNGREITAFKESKIGVVPYFQVKAGISGEPVKVTGQIACPNFFGGKKSNPPTGIPAGTLSYQYTNKSQNRIDSYTVKFMLPEGMEPLSVTAPKSVTSYKLGFEDGKRTLSYEVKKGIAPAGSASIAFTYGVPFSERGSVLTAIWCLILAVSSFVAYKRLKGEKTA